MIDSGTISLVLDKPKFVTIFDAIYNEAPSRRWMQYSKDQG